MLRLFVRPISGPTKLRPRLFALRMAVRPFRASACAMDSVAGPAPPATTKAASARLPPVTSRTVSTFSFFSEPPRLLLRLGDL